MCDVLIAQVGDERRGRVADDLVISYARQYEASTAYFVISLVCSPELADQADQDQLSNLR